MWGSSIPNCGPCDKKSSGVLQSFLNFVNIPTPDDAAVDKDEGKDKNKGKDKDKDKKPATSKYRFGIRDRVVCFVGGQYGWQVGTVQMLDQPHPEKKDIFFPYITQLDNLNRLVSVPHDDPGCCRPEVCFEDSFRGEPCLTDVAPLGAPSPRPTLRFGVGDRVVCLTAGPGGEEWHRTWLPCTVVETWYQAPVWPDQVVPYRVVVDVMRENQRKRKREHGVHLSVHKDTHTLIRSLALQKPGRFVDADRFTRRTRTDGGREVIDQQTRKVRVATAYQQLDQKV